MTWMIFVCKQEVLVAIITALCNAHTFSVSLYVKLGNKLHQLHHTKSDCMVTGYMQVNKIFTN